MQGHDLTQRLAAILAADASGYSRLMAGDERATVLALDAARAVFRMRIEENQGRVVDTAGDSVLAIFPTAIGAVQSAMAIQQGLKELAADKTEDQCLHFRIGLHLGDVIEKSDGTIYGDGVNIAARLQALAEPGNIMVSESVRTAVRGKISLAFIDQGEQTVKNIPEPVRTFSLGASGKGKPETATPGIDLSLPDKPSIAVLAFANMSGDPEQEYFTDGITEDIITELSRFDSLFVIARNSSFSYKGKAVNVKQIGRELGVRYLVEGSIRRAGGRIRVTAQLIDSLSGNHVWAERYDRDVQDIFAVQEEVTGCIVAAIAPQVDVAEILRTRSRPGNLTAYELTVRAWGLGWAGVRKSDRALKDESMRLIDAALAIDAENQMALIGVAFDRWIRVSQRWVDNREAVWLEGLDAANRAIGIAPSAWGHAAKAVLLAAAPAGARWRDALTEAQVAYRLNPRDCLVIGIRGMVEANAGDVAKAIELLESAIRMNPRDPYAFNIYTDLAYACFFNGEYQRGAEWVERAISAAPEFVLAHLCAAVLNVGLGDMTRASAALAEAQRISPELVKARLRSKGANRVGNARQRYDVFLRIASGLEEPSAAAAWR